MSDQGEYRGTIAYDNISGGGHGGKREGAGRPAPDGPTRKVSIRLTQANHVRLKRFPNLSAKINEILALFFKEAAPDD